MSKIEEVWGSKASRWWDYLTSPRSWCFIVIRPYSREWDNRLLELMAEHKFVRTGDHTATLGGLCVWVANHPYGSFTPYRPKLEIRASRATTMLAMRKLISDTLPEATP